jgi:dGTPase
MNPVKSGIANDLFSRHESEARERETLSPHATLSAETMGRLFPEEEHPLRTPFQRDRDRLIHSTAFRRLEYKTQVFVNHEGDYYRTRLTHTLEVVQIARSLARFLRLNEDLAEAMALAHDLGHTPFGHSVEEVLNELVEADGGFEHNAQGLRSVDILETPYPDFPGLNLTYEVRSIFTKKASMTALCQNGFASPESRKFDGGPAKPILEAQIVDLADGIAYNSHDVDDGLKSGLLSLEALEEAPLWEEAWKEARGVDASSRRHSAIRQLINRQVTDAAQETLKRMRQADLPHLKWECAEYPPLSQIERVVDFSPAMRKSDNNLKEFLRSNLYRHPQVTRPMDRARDMIRRLFEAYSQRPEQMAAQFRGRVGQEPLKRVVSDYIAGMTDRFAEDEYISLFMPGSLLARSR